MKQIKSTLLIIVATIGTLSSCSKKSNTTPVQSTTTLPAQVTTIVSTQVLDSMQKAGVIVNKGTTPPSLAGIFLIHPYICTFDDSPGQYAGSTFDDYKYKFSEQNKSAFTIRVDYLDVNTPSTVLSDSTATFISGHDDFFTVYAKVNAVRSGVNFVLIDVVSGEITSTGIKNFQNSTYVLSKDPDPNGYAEPLGAIRVFHDSDFLSEPQTTFSYM